MTPRKRGRAEMEGSEPPKEMSLLEKIRNMWEFASFMQYVFVFGEAVKIDKDFDIEVPHRRLLRPFVNRPWVYGGVFPTLGLTDSLVIGFRNGMFAAWILRQIGRHWTDAPEMGLVASGARVSSIRAQRPILVN